MNMLESAVRNITTSVDASRNVIQEIDQTTKNIIEAGKNTVSHQKNLEEEVEAANFGERILSG
jgi:hypothetical protein